MKIVDWHHAPLHKFVPGGVHMITGATLHKQHFFSGVKRLDLFQEMLLRFMGEHRWIPHAWACFSNHYHVIVNLPEAGAEDEVEEAGKEIKRLHQALGYALNRLDQVTGRTVMYQYWDTCLSFENSYFARLNYVMNNPVKHGLVEDARLYPWSSAKWFAANHSSAMRRRVAAYKIDRVNEPDSFEVEG